MAGRVPRQSAPPTSQSLQQLFHEICSLLSTVQPPGRIEDNFDIVLLKRLLAQLVASADVLIVELERLLSSDPVKFENAWADFAWPCLTLATMLRDRTGDREIAELEERLNITIVTLVNLWRNPIQVDSNSLDVNYQWQQFNALLTATLQSIHAIYSRGEVHRDLYREIQHFKQNELAVCLLNFKQFCFEYSKEILPLLRESQMERVSLCKPIPVNLVARAENYFSKIIYCMGIMVARLQGFRYWHFAGVEPVRPMIDSVASVVEQLLAECLFCSEPRASPILVTNNLFPFRSGCLAKGPIFHSFTIQIIGEETAQIIQDELRYLGSNLGLPSSVLSSRSFPSAALLAMKPTSGTKRNNSTANADGGNTAHKKSDVNSKESVQLAATFSEKHGTWTASYPHLLCTTRQKDTTLLDTRSNQIGKRSLFYFYIRGRLFSPRGPMADVYTLSLPFTIATRRNQDCQVQRMISSYTATCFWLYGTCSLDGLILRWTEADISWDRFKELYKAHFRATAEVSRDLSESDFTLLEQKICCKECGPAEKLFQDERVMVSFKNVMCPHLQYASDICTKFSIWRGLLEILLLFQDAKTAVKSLWDENYLLGFLDCDRAKNLLLAHSSAALCFYLSYAAGGSICFVMKRMDGRIIHLEPLDLKKLQSKSLNEYVADIAAAENIHFLVNADGMLVPIDELTAKYPLGNGAKLGKQATSNVTHAGTTSDMREMRFTPVRIAVVTCGDQPTEQPMEKPKGRMMSLNNMPYLNQPVGQVSTPPITPATYCANMLQSTQLLGSDFNSQLRQLMKAYGKEPEEVCAQLQYFIGYGGNGEPTNGALHPYPVQRQQSLGIP